MELWFGDYERTEIQAARLFFAVYAAGGGKRNMANFARSANQSYTQADLYLYLAPRTAAVDLRHATLEVARQASSGDWTFKPVPDWLGQDQVKPLPEWFKTKFWNNKQEKNHPWFAFRLQTASGQCFVSPPFAVHQYYPQTTNPNNPEYFSRTVLPLQQHYDRVAASLCTTVCMAAAPEPLPVTRSAPVAIPRASIAAPRGRSRSMDRPRHHAEMTEDDADDLDTLMSVAAPSPLFTENMDMAFETALPMAPAATMLGSSVPFYGPLSSGNCFVGSPQICMLDLDQEMPGTPSDAAFSPPEQYSCQPMDWTSPASTKRRRLSFCNHDDELACACPRCNECGDVLLMGDCQTCPILAQCVSHYIWNNVLQT